MIGSPAFTVLEGKLVGSNSQTDFNQFLDTYVQEEKVLWLDTFLTIDDEIEAKKISFNPNQENWFQLKKTACQPQLNTEMRQQRETLRQQQEKFKCLKEEKISEARWNGFTGGLAGGAIGGAIVCGFVCGGFWYAGYLTGKAAIGWTLGGTVISGLGCGAHNAYKEGKKAEAKIENAAKNVPLQRMGV
jgi:hypothetical protein